MFQWILTIVIVLAAFLYAGMMVKKRFFSKKEEKDPDCKGCSSDCASCPLSPEEMKKKRGNVIQSSDQR